MSFERLSPETTRTPQLEPRIYAASLTDYNHGHLHGAWIDAVQSAGDILSDIRDMLAGSPTAKRHGEPAEEWAMHDYKDFGPLRLSEYESIDTVAALAAGLAEHGQAFAHWVAHTGMTDTEELHKFDEAYLGEWDSLADYVENLLEDHGLDRLLNETLPESFRAYLRIDTEAIAGDLKAGGYLATSETGTGSVYVFDTTV